MWGRDGARVWSVVACAVLAVGLSGVAAVADEVVPAPVVTLWPEEAWASTGWVEASWSVDYVGELSGWAVLFDEFADSDPGDLVTQGDAWWGSELADGVYWLHVRAIDADGLPGALTHTRVAVDGSGPVVEGLTSSTHPAGEPSGESVVGLSWDVPVDVSGVVGYQVEVASSEDGGPADLSEGVVSTTSTAATVTLSGDGDWLVGVRALDGAGLWGAYATYEVVLDADAPGVPVVSGSHQAGVASTQRHVVLSFVQGDGGDWVASWVASIDQSATATLDAADARPEPRITATLNPGQYWLHVAGVDSLGRLGSVLDYPLVIASADAVLDLPDSTHLWGAPGGGTQWFDAWCTQDPDGAQVVAIDADQTRHLVADLTGDTAACGFGWDVSALVDEARVWPDGDYRLVVVDDGQDVSIPIPVTIATTQTPVERIDADYQAGRIDAEQQALLLMAAMAGTLDAPYAVPGATATPDPVALIGAATANGYLSPAMAELLTPTDTTTAERSRTAEQAESDPTSWVQGCDQQIAYTGLTFDCVAVTDDFVVLYGSQAVGQTSQGAELPDFVTMITTSLERARTTYLDNGFAVPDERVIVGLSWMMPSGKGVALPSAPVAQTLGLVKTPPAILMSSSSSDVKEYLPHHEFFHQVEYQYFDGPGRMINPVNSPYWWMEACAEWGAALVQSSDDSFEDSRQYASGLGEFIANSQGRYDSGTISAGGPEYGAFVLAEYLTERYGVDAVERTWSKIGSWFGQSPAQAIRGVIIDEGDDYGDQIHQFRTWMYSLADAENRDRHGFSTPDANDGGLWRQAMDSPDPNTVRPPHQPVDLGAQATVVSQPVPLSAGGAWYVEFTPPAGVRGYLTVSVEGPDQSVRATLIPDVQFPQLCPYYASRAASSTSGQATVFGRQATESMSVVMQGDCPGVVLVITNSAAMGSPTVLGDQPDPKSSYTYTATFTPTALTRDNGTLKVGIYDTGVLGYQGIGVERLNGPATSTSERWGIAAGQEEQGYSQPQGTIGVDSFNVDVQSFTYLTGSALSVSQVGGLIITHQIRASSDPNLYAIDVTVARAADSAANSEPVLYRRTATWGITGSTRRKHISLWQKAPGGDDTKVAAITDAASGPNPYYPAQVNQNSGYATSGPLAYPGHTLDLNLGVIAPGDQVSFHLYYGVAPTLSAAQAAVDQVDADVSYLVYAQDLTTSTPATGIFAYRTD